MKRLDSESAPEDLPEHDGVQAASASAAADEEQKESDELPGDPLPDDEQTTQAIDDIVAHESDEVLEAEDAAAAHGNEPLPKRGFWGSIGHFIAWWFVSSKGRWLLFGLMVAGATAAAAVQPARYWVLNSAGVRASASLTVVDDLTQLPLQNVPVTLGVHKQLTDSKGNAAFANLRLGPTNLSVAQPGFADVRQQVTIGWGSNPLSTYGLHATGSRYTFQVHDYLSGKPVAGVVATSGLASALSDADGKIALTLENASPAQQVMFRKDGYRSEQATLKPSGQTISVVLVTARKDVFVAKQDGKYDLFKSDIDGANRTLLLAGTGSESANIALAASIDGSHVALVSTRDNQHDADGFPLSTLTLVNSNDGTVLTIARAEQLQLVGWIGSRLVFEQVSTDANTPAASRYTVVSYDYNGNTRLQLAADSKLNGVFSAQGAIYYAVAADPVVPAQHPGLYQINPDGTNKQLAVDAEIWTGLRADYNTLDLQTADGWLRYDLTNGTHDSISGPANFTSRLYADNADASKSLWVNQGVLTLFDTATGKDAVLQTQAGLGYPLRWLGDDIAVYRVVTGSETADYAASLFGGLPHKIADVVPTYGFTQSQ